MLSSLGFPHASIRIVPHNEAALLQPDLGPEGLADTSINGHVVLTLPKARRLSTQIHVKLVGEYNSIFPTGLREKGIIRKKEVVIKLNDVILEKGDHCFIYNFRIPATSTCSQERNETGWILYQVHAEVQGIGFNASALRTSKPITVTLNNASAGDLSAYELEIQDLSGALGPVFLTVRAPHLTVGSMLAFSFALPSVPHDVAIQCISGVIKQKVTLKSIQYPSHLPVKLPVKQIPLFLIDASHPASSISAFPTPSSHTKPLVHLSPNSPFFKITHRARLANDSTLRPTVTSITDPVRSITGRYPFLITHDLAICITYHVVGDSECCCAVESLLVPPYSKGDPLAFSTPEKHGRQHGHRCVCCATSALLDEQLGADGTSNDTASSSAASIYSGSSYLSYSDASTNYVGREWKPLSARYDPQAQ